MVNFYYRYNATEPEPNVTGFYELLELLCIERHKNIPIYKMDEILFRVADFHENTVGESEHVSILISNAYCMVFSIYNKFITLFLSVSPT